jgi:hypothetical protein
VAGRGQTFLGDATWQEVKDVVFCIRMPDCPVKNVEKPLELYSVRGIIPQGVDLPAPGADERVLEAVLFCLPCVLNGPDYRIEGVVTRIMRGGDQGAKFVLQLGRPLPVGANVTLNWNIPEKPSLPAVQGEVEKCWQPKAAGTEAMAAVLTAAAGTPPKGGTAVMATTVIPGSLVLNVKTLPPEIAAWKPGTLLQSDLTSHEQIIRA